MCYIFNLQLINNLRTFWSLLPVVQLWKIAALLCVKEEDVFTPCNLPAPPHPLFLPHHIIVSPQIFYDLVRQINRKTPVEKKKAKKKSNCVLL